MITVCVQPFDATFGKQKQRKRPRLASDSLSELLTRTEATNSECAPLPSMHTSQCTLLPSSTR